MGTSEAKGKSSRPPYSAGSIETADDRYVDEGAPDTESARRAREERQKRKQESDRRERR